VLNQARADRLLTVVILADGVVWLVATLQVLAINRIGMNQLHLGEMATSSLVVAELCGVAVGGGLCSLLAQGERWYRVLAPAGALLTAAALAVASLPLLGVAEPTHVLYLALFVAGAAGGLLLVPLESFIQSRPAAERKGQTIAAANFTAFIGILLAGLGSVALERLPLATSSFALIAAVTFALTLWLMSVLRRDEVTRA